MQYADLCDLRAHIEWIVGTFGTLAQTLCLDSAHRSEYMSAALAGIWRGKAGRHAQTYGIIGADNRSLHAGVGDGAVTEGLQGWTGWSWAMECCAPRQAQTWRGRCSRASCRQQIPALCFVFARGCTQRTFSPVSSVVTSR